MSEKVMKFNANNYIKVKLTDYGREIWHKLKQDLKERHPHLNISLELKEVDGWSKWQLWNFMGTFGAYVSLGGRQVFDSDIVLILKEQAESD